MLGDIDSFWEYGDPEASEKCFRAILGEVEGDERLEVLTQIAQWSVARCLRSLGRYGEALARQQQLEREHQHAGTKDGYVFEEIAENMAALGKLNEAMPYFQKAAEQLSLDVWFVEHEAQRLAYLWKNAGIP